MSRGLPPNYTTTKNTTKIERTTTTDFIGVFTWSVSQNLPKQLSDWSVLFLFQIFPFQLLFGVSVHFRQIRWLQQIIFTRWGSSVFGWNLQFIDVAEPLQM
jgi:hypothetical protein